MKNAVLVLILILTGMTAQAVDHCAEESADGPFIYRAHVNDWEQTPEVMAAKYKEFYDSSRRLKYRFFKRDGKILAPIKGNGADISHAEVSENFIEAVKSNVIEAQDKKYAKHVFFPDMGHAHLHLAKKSELLKRENALRLPEAEALTLLMKDPDLKLLYHTAEQLATPNLKEMSGDRPDAALKLHLWRTLNRHLLGSVNGQKIEVFLDDSDMRAAGNESVVGQVYISANRSGCFSYQYKDEQVFFDMSYVPYGPDPNAPPVESEDE